MTLLPLPPEIVVPIPSHRNPRTPRQSFNRGCRRILQPTIAPDHFMDMPTQIDITTVHMVVDRQATSRSFHAALCPTSNSYSSAGFKYSLHVTRFTTTDRCWHRGDHARGIPLRRKSTMHAKYTHRSISRPLYPPLGSQHSVLSRLPTRWQLLGAAPLSIRLPGLPLVFWSKSVLR